METPSRTSVDAKLARAGRTLLLSFDVDLGELMPGHHVVARGIEKGRLWPSRAASPVPMDEVDRLHFEHVPGLTDRSPTPDWGFTISDDVGAKYVEDEGGAYDGHSGGTSTHGIRDLGWIPEKASTLKLTIHPSRHWKPPGPWRHELVIDLRTGTVID